MEPLLFRLELAALIGAALAIGLLLACSRGDTTGDLRTEAEMLRARTVPSGATLRVVEAPTISVAGSGAAIWEIDGKLGWPAYRKWLIVQLTEFTCVQGDAVSNRVAFFRALPGRNEMWTVTAELVYGQRFRVEFRVVPG
jgi:hypothetical protein